MWNWAGHAVSAHHLHFGPVVKGDPSGCPRHIVTAAPGEHTVSVWACPKEGREAGEAEPGSKQQPAGPVCTLQVPHPVRTLSFAGRCVLAVCSDGSTQVWEIGPDSKGSRTTADCPVQGVRPDTIVDATTRRSADSEEAIFALGTIAVPFFVRVPLRTPHGALVASLKLPKESRQAREAAQSALLPASKRRRVEEAKGKAKVRTEGADRDADGDALRELGSSARQTLGFRRQQMLQRGVKAVEEQRVRLTEALQQALLREDGRQLLSLLRRGGRNLTLIEPTVRGLDRIAALQLLRECVSRFQLKAARRSTAEILPWIQAVLAVHPHHLLSVPDLSRLLLPLQGVLQSHLRNFETLSSLYGRLRVVTRNAESSAGLSSSSYKNVPLVREADVREAAATAPYALEAGMESEDDEEEEPANEVGGVDAELSDDSEEEGEEGEEAEDEDEDGDEDEKGGGGDNEDDDDDAEFQ